MTDAKKQNEDSRSWFLRTGGETVFGPVSSEGLVAWAEQGRILPGHEVSNDRKKWVQAVSVELLDMRWFVDDGEGELRGPLNRSAAEALIKSGKVSPQAQLVSADDVESAPDTAKEDPAPAGKVASDPVPEDVLRVRIRELEAMVTDQRERLEKLSKENAIETVQHERDVLASLVKEMESQRETLLRNAEKDTRTSERKIEQLRQQVRKLEQQLEESNGRLLMEASAPVSAPASGSADGLRQELEAQHKTELAKIQGEADARIQQAVQTASELRDKTAELEARMETARKKAESEETAFAEERAALTVQIASLKQAVDFHEKKGEETHQIVSAREAELAESKRRLEESERQRIALKGELDEAGWKLRESEAAFAELLGDANARDNTYAEKVAALEKACAQSPEEIARFYADQAAVFELAKAEVEELSKTMEMERTHIDQIKEWSVQRQQALTERKQTLMKQLGRSPAEMTRRSLREQPSDPNAARLRTELDELRVAHEREILLASDRERELQRKLRVLESESAKLQGLAINGEKAERRMLDLSEQLRKREQELADERKSREAEREQFQGSQHALIARIDELEKASRPSSPEEMRSAEARNVRIATWMRLKK